MLKVLDLFSGIGGFSLGLERAGMKTVAFCEIDAYCRAVLRRHWPEVPIYHDVRELTGEKLRADGISVDVICGGFPCQDASVANTDGRGRLGSDGPRTGLWRHVIRLAAEFPQAILILENVPGLLSSGFGDILGALAESGRDAEWRCISAASAGLPHNRARLWIVAYAERAGLPRYYEGQGVLGAAEAALAVASHDPSGARDALVENCERIRDGDGLTVAMERRRVHAIGNAVVPQIPEIIGRAILEAQRT